MRIQIWLHSPGNIDKIKEDKYLNSALINTTGLHKLQRDAINYNRVFTSLGSSRSSSISMSSGTLCLMTEPMPRDKIKINLKLTTKENIRKS